MRASKENAILARQHAKALPIYKREGDNAMFKVSHDLVVAFIESCIGRLPTEEAYEANNARRRAKRKRAAK